MKTKRLKNFYKGARCIVGLFIVYIFATFIPSSGWAVTNKLSDFKSDGCSLSPDGLWGERNAFLGCCITHDIAYWKGGTPAEREAADQDFKRCLSEQGYSKMSYVYYIGVRLGGSNLINTPFKWGYGWLQERGDGPLTEQEKRLVQEKLRDTDFLDVLLQGL